MARIHQFTAGFANGDAISNEVRFIQSTLRAQGHTSEIYSEARRILPQLRKHARDVATFEAEAQADDIVILHLSIGSIINDVFLRARCRKAIRYHNITPEQYFRPIHKETTANLAWGRRQMEGLAGVADLNMAVSRFNAGELETAGYSDVRVVPLLIDFGELENTRDRKVMRSYKGSPCTVLSVGRVAPNKCIEDSLRAFSLFQQHHCPDARYVHVGSFAGAERYYSVLTAMTRDLGIRNVLFTGAVPQAELNAYYASATMTLCMSEHEGFCIPLLESMAHARPVLAMSDGAIPETLDGAGVLFAERDHALVAEAMQQVAQDRALRDAIVAAQTKRLARYRARDLGAELLDALAPLTRDQDG